MAQHKNNPGNDRWYWFLACALIFTGGLAPIGILMLVIRLLNGNTSSRSQNRTAYAPEPQNLGAKTNAYVAPAPAAPAPKRKKGRSGIVLDRMAAKAKRLTLWGGVIAGLCSLVCIMTAVDDLWMLPGDLAWFLEETIPSLCFAAVGGGMLWTGLHRKKQVRQYRQYLNMIGQKKSISISSLASATGTSPEQVRATLENMMECDLFPAGYLDYGGDKLILSGGLAEPAKKSAPPPEKENEGENAVLAEIRAINDDIDDEKLSAQIDRIGIITAKIFEYQKSHPENSPQLHSFLSYYLPTTLKILRAYAQLEDQEVDGENITAAMERIENMMDKVVEGFETQLDKLFQGDVMDITADVEVLERMLAKDGLAEQPGLTLNS